MKLKPGIVMLIAPVALSFGLWIDQMIAQETHNTFRQPEIKIETVDQSNTDHKIESAQVSEPSSIIAFM